MDLSDTSVQGVLFDKDGTLIDFSGTWSRLTGQLIDELADGDGAVAAKIAAAMGFDRQEMDFLPDSLAIGSTSREVAAAIASAMPGRDVEQIERLMVDRTVEAQMMPVVALGPLFEKLKSKGRRLGLATNDNEAVARANLADMNVAEAFDFVAGFDSGFGGKPEPGMLLAFCEEMSLSPEACVMVGDSPHDLLAAQRAGMRGVGVLTGVYTRTDLEALAEVILPDIGHLPSWLETRATP